MRRAAPAVGEVLELQSGGFGGQLPRDLSGRRNGLGLNFPRAGEPVKHFDVDMGQFLRISAGVTVVPLKFGVMFSLFRTFGMVMLVMIVFVMTLLFTMVLFIMMFIVIVFVIIMIGRFDLYRGQLAGCGSGQDEHGAGVAEDGHGFFDRLSVGGIPGRVLEPDNIGPRRYQFHFKRVAVDRQFQLADAMLVRVPMPFLGVDRPGE